MPVFQTRARQALPLKSVHVFTVRDGLPSSSQHVVWGQQTMRGQRTVSSVQSASQRTIPVGLTSPVIMLPEVTSVVLRHSLKKQTLPEVTVTLPELTDVVMAGVVTDII